MSGVLTSYPNTRYINQANSNSLTTQLTTVTHTAASSADYALQDLTSSGGFGFATKDEGNTLLAVVANLQTRMAELEVIIDALNILE